MLAAATGVDDVLCSVCALKLNEPDKISKTLHYIAAQFYFKQIPRYTFYTGKVFTVPRRDHWNFLQKRLKGDASNTPQTWLFERVQDYFTINALHKLLTYLLTYLLAPSKRNKEKQKFTCHDAMMPASSEHHVTNS